jgi:hypothetical protein
MSFCRDEVYIFWSVASGWSLAERIWQTITKQLIWTIIHSKCREACVGTIPLRFFS